ncbi:MAG: hypothetical protein ABSF09_10060 [Candidatus Bathyarchaeia archaeon]
MQSNMGSTSSDYMPAILFLLASGLLIPLFYYLFLTGSLSPLAVQISTLVMLAIIVSLICWILVRDVRFYAFAVTAIGMGLRAACVILFPVSSDVLAVSAQGAALILSGQNPYQVLDYRPGKFAYPPLEPLFYIPFRSIDPRWAEFVSSSIILTVLLITTLRSKNKNISILYLAIYSLSLLMSGFVGLSTNDTSASLFPFLAMWIIMFSSARRKFDYAGILLGLGVAFKQFGIFPMIFAIALLIKHKGPWLRTAILGASTVATISLPFLIWSPTNFLSEVIFFHLAERVISPYYVLVALYPQLLGPWLLVLQFSLTIILGAWLFRRINTWRECQIAWTCVFLVSLFLGRYFAPSYFAFIMPFWILAGIP